MPDLRSIPVLEARGPSTSTSTRGLLTTSHPAHPRRLGWQAGRGGGGMKKGALHFTTSSATPRTSRQELCGRDYLAAGRASTPNVSLLTPPSARRREAGIVKCCAQNTEREREPHVAELTRSPRRSNKLTSTRAGPDRTERDEREMFSVPMIN